MDDDICSNFYQTEVFDTQDSQTDRRIRGNMHSEVKVYSKAEIEKFELDRLDKLV